VVGRTTTVVAVGRTTTVVEVGRTTTVVDATSTDVATSAEHEATEMSASMTRSRVVWVSGMVGRLGGWAVWWSV
jgi:hypothetical protein